MAEWLKHQTVNLGNLGSSPSVPAISYRLRAI